MKFLPKVGKILRKKENYSYLISIGNITKLSAPITKIHESNSIRGFSRLFIAPDPNECDKKIIYPPELWITDVKEDDEVEKELMSIVNDWPNWYKIEIKSKHNHLL